jgi:hypothetical protein
VKPSLILALGLLFSGLSAPAFAQSGEYEPRCDDDGTGADLLTHFEAVERAQWFRTNFPDKIFEHYSSKFHGHVQTVEQALAQYDRDMKYALGGRLLRYSAYPSFLHVDANLFVTDPDQWIAPKSAGAPAFMPAGYRMTNVCYAREEGINMRDLIKEERLRRSQQIMDDPDWARDPLRDRRNGLCSKPGPKPSFCR